MNGHNEQAARMEIDSPKGEPEHKATETDRPVVDLTPGGPKQLKKGDRLVWLGGICAATTLGLFITLVTVVLTHGLGTFWASRYTLLSYKDGKKVLGAVQAEDLEQNKLQLYIGNRDLYGLDYRWVSLEDLTAREQPRDMVKLERTEKGSFLGFLKELHVEDEVLRDDPDVLFDRLRDRMVLMRGELDGSDEILERMAAITREMERTRLKLITTKDPAERQKMEAAQEQRRKQFDGLNKSMDARRLELRKELVVMTDAGGREQSIALMDITRAYRPNRMGFFDRLGLYADKVGELLTAMPRESNTEGGLYPAILGTVLMVMLMSVFCVPLGVVAAVYLREYAKEGLMVNLVRIAVNNLAGVPSIVYGMFGLGFFVYGIGGSIDSLFFPERAPLPTFGTGGLLWASLTMALLTVPVVIVSTEEGLSSVPQGVRDGSLALGATKFQTLLRVVMPMATPGILTGLILAIARAAGEVAPLMLVGVVKSVHNLPVTGEFPFVKLEHKIMHLGFHIFDVGFQSPNVEAAKPMVYVTTLLLLMLVLGMSFLAMFLRNKMKKRYTLGAF